MSYRLIEKQGGRSFHSLFRSSFAVSSSSSPSVYSIKNTSLSGGTKSIKASIYRGTLKCFNRGFCSTRLHSLGAIDITLVKKLRTASGAPIADCKKALMDEEVNGDLDKAFEWLRKKGQSFIQKSTRAASEGLIGICVNDENTRASVVEVNSETDFVARNVDFQKYVVDVASSVLGSIEKSETSSELSMESTTILTIPYLGDANKSIENALADAVAKIRENISIKRASVIDVSNGILGIYIHNAMGEQLGAQAAIVALKSESTPLVNVSVERKIELETIAKKLAMHIVAAKPLYLSTSSVPNEIIEKEKSIHMEKALATGKPENVIQKIVDGSVNKWLKEIALLEQPHMIIEGNPRIAKYISTSGQELGIDDLTVDAYVYFQVGGGN